jgi:preprotein translocase subunit SecE
MSKMESMIKLEIIRLAKREVRKVWFPLRRDVRLMKGIVSQLRNSVLALQRFAAQ